MNNPQTVLLLQAIFGFLQTANIGLATSKDVHVPGIVLILLSSLMTAIQVYLQHSGNKIEPAPKPQDPPKAP